MDKYDLQRENSALEREIYELRATIRQFEAELAMITNAAVAAQNKLVQTSNRINESMDRNNHSMTYAQNQVSAVIQQQGQINKLYYMFKEMETANKKIRELNNVIYYQFQNHRKMRKIVRHFFDNMDFNLVNEDLIFRIVEKSFLETSEFWASYAILAVMHWKLGDQDRMERSLKQALAIDAKSTSLFFLLVNLKLERTDTALNWLNYYQSIEKTGADSSIFYILISAINKKLDEGQLSDPFIKRSTEIILDTIKKEAVDKEAIESNIQSQWSRLSENRVHNYPWVKKYVSQANKMQNALNGAYLNINILEYLDEMRKVPSQFRNNFFNEFIETLVDMPAKDEVEIRRAIKLNEEILNVVKRYKDQNLLESSSTLREMATKSIQEQIKHDEHKLCLTEEIIHWVYDQGQHEMSQLTKWNMFFMTREYAKKAYEKHQKAYQQEMPKSFDVQLDGYSLKTNFANKDKDAKLVKDYYESQQHQMLSGNRKTKFMTYLILSGVLLIASGILFLGITPLDSGWAYLGIVLAAICLFTSLAALFKYRKTNKWIYQSTSDKIDQSKGIIEKVYQEFYRFMDEYKQADQVSSDIHLFFKNIN